MPRTVIDYSNTCFYKVVCNDLNVLPCYVGHTTDFRKRKTQHKTVCNNEKSPNHNLTVYRFIRDNGGWNNWSMVLIENKACENALEACKRERELIEELQSELNDVVPSRSKKEWAEDHKETIKSYKHEYHQTNLETIHDKKKEYYLANRERTLAKSKQYHAENKEKRNAFYNQVRTCECGLTFTVANKARHELTKKHIELINQKI